MEDLITYFIRITPGVTLVALIFFLLPRKQIVARIFVLILGFILMRDAMTPTGLWNFGITDSAVWLRFIDSSEVLFVIGALSLIMAGLLLRVRELQALVWWGDVRSWRAYVVGFFVGLLVAVPFILLGLTIPIEQRGGVVEATILPALLFMALAGNFLEELVFRGFLQSYYQKQMTSIRAAVLSGLTFAAAHIFLASTVTDLGWPLLLFVTIEGLACAFVYRRFGLLSASIVHGVAIFVLASGLL